MKLSTYHAHTTFCDGKSTAEQMILAAIERGCPEIGLSGHSFLPGEPWTMTEEESVEYRKAVCKLKEKYRDRIRIYLGLEQDYLTLLSPEEYKAYDYIIGSVHSVNVADREIAVDNSAAVTADAIKKYFGGDPYAYCESYYARVAEIYERTRCDIIGHFDLVTKFIERDPIFSEQHPRYIKARSAALAELLKTPALFEVNTGAISRGYRTKAYPHSDVISEIAGYGRPFVINSDSHTSETVDFAIDEIARSLDSQGVRYVSSLAEALAITRA